MPERQYTQRTPEQWQAHLDRQAQSGLSIKDYCKEQSLALSNFYGWRKKLASKDDESEPVERSAWIALDARPTPLPSQTTSTEMVLTLPVGIELSIRSD